MRYPKGSKVIRTSSGAEILVSAEDHAYLSQFTWYIHHSRSGKYARTTYQGQKILMHRLLMGVVFASWKGIQVDHRNRSTLDNRRSNLVLVSPAVNQRNRRSWKWVRREVG